MDKHKWNGKTINIWNIGLWQVLANDR